MESIETEKIIKLLNLTTSDNDHEALSAIRMANAILKKANQTWVWILKGETPPEQKQNHVHPGNTIALSTLKSAGFQVMEQDDELIIFLKDQRIVYNPKTRLCVFNNKKYRWSLTTLMMFLRGFDETLRS